MPHTCPECFDECNCADGEESQMDCQHDCEDAEQDFSDDEAQYNYED